MSAATARPRLLSLCRPLLMALSLAGCHAGSGQEPANADAEASAPEAAKAVENAEPLPPTLPEASAVLQRAAEAMGGKNTIHSVASFYYRGTIELVGQNIRGDVQIWWKDGDFFMEQIVPGIGEMRAGKKGEEIWAEDPINGRRRLSGAEAEQHAWASSILLAANWERYFTSAKTTAERTVDGTSLVDVQLRSESGLEVMMSFDATSGLQVGQSFEQVSPMGPQPFSVNFEDYRDVDGVKIAFRQIIDADPHTLVQVIEEVKINPEIDESRFAFPRRGADLVRQGAK